MYYPILRLLNHLRKVCMSVVKLPPYQRRLLKERKEKYAEYQRIRRLVKSKSFIRFSNDERVLLVRQMNLLKQVLYVIEERIELF